jgi:hypothetical protein
MAQRTKPVVEDLASRPLSSMVCLPWSMVRSPWSVVHRLLFIVLRPRSVVRCPWSVVHELIPLARANMAEG